MATQAELDTAAQHLGYHNYATWQAWDAKYRHPNEPVQQIQPDSPVYPNPAQTGAPAPAQNWFQQLLGHIPPFSAIGAVNDAYTKANGG